MSIWAYDVFTLSVKKKLGTISSFFCFQCLLEIIENIDITIEMEKGIGHMYIFLNSNLFKKVPTYFFFVFQTQKECERQKQIVAC